MITIRQFDVMDKLSDSNEQIENIKNKSECREKNIGKNLIKRHNIVFVNHVSFGKYCIEVF